MNSVMDIKLKYANMLSTAATIIITPDATFFFLTMMPPIRPSAAAMKERTPKMMNNVAENEISRESGRNCLPASVVF